MRDKIQKLVLEAVAGTKDITEVIDELLCLTNYCCKGTGFIDLPNGDDVYCSCEEGKKQKAEQYKD